MSLLCLLTVMENLALFGKKFSTAEGPQQKKNLLLIIFGFESGQKRLKTLIQVVERSCQNNKRALFLHFYPNCVSTQAI